MLGLVAFGADEIVRVKGKSELQGFKLQRVHCICKNPGIVAQIRSNTQIKKIENDKSEMKYGE